MLGKKKKKDEKKESFVPKTEMQEVAIMLESRQTMLKFTLDELKEQYHGVFSPDAMKNIDQDQMTLDLLFAIFSEMRLLREIFSKDQK
jgi:hypothetical protein